MPRLPTQVLLSVVWPSLLCVQHPSHPLFLGPPHLLLLLCPCRACGLQVSRAVRDSLTVRAADFGIVLEDIAITHLSFGTEFTKVGGCASLPPPLHPITTTTISTQSMPDFLSTNSTAAAGAAGAAAAAAAANSWQSKVSVHVAQATWQQLVAAPTVQWRLRAASACIRLQ